jgi:hypothetical protein
MYQGDIFMYVRQYKLICEGPANMERFRIIGTQGLTFEQLMKRNNVKPPTGFISATDDHFDNTRWEITTKWETKADFEEGIKHPMRKWFWNRFEMEAFKHDIKLQIIDGDTGEVYEPLAIPD